MGSGGSVETRPLSPPWRAELAAAAAIALAVALLFLGVVTGRQHLWGDFVTWYFPSHEYAAERIRHGSAPLWNPYLDCGMPFMGEADHGTLYPPSLLLIPFATHRPLLFWMLEIFTLLHLCWAGLSVYLLLRSLGCGRAPALTGGLVFALGGVFVARTAQVSLVTAQSWVPAALGGAYHALRAGPTQRRRHGALACALGLGMVGLCGSPATLTVTVVGLAVVTLTALDRRSALRSIGFVAAAGVIGLLLCAAQLAPMMEFVRASERMAYTYDEVADFGVEPDNLVMLIVPRFNGWLVYDEISYWGSGNFAEVTGYTGLLSLGLLTLALRFRPRADTLPWAALAVLGLWLAIGEYGGLHWLLYRYAPSWIGMMRAPGRYLLLWAVGVSVLAGLGLDAALRAGDLQRAAVRRWATLLVAVVVGVMVTISLASPAYVANLAGWKRPWFQSGIRIALLASAAGSFGLLLLARGRPGPAPRLGALIALAAAAELVIQGRGIGVVSGRDRVDRLLQSGDYERLLQNDRTLFRVKDAFGEQSRLMLSRLQGVSGPGRHLLDFELYRSRILSHYSPAFDLLDIKYLVALEPATTEDRTPTVIAQPYIWLAQGAESALPIDPPILARGFDLVSTVDGTWGLTSGAPIGDVELLGTQGERLVIPIRFGIETGDIDLGGPVTSARPVPVAYAEGVEDALTVQRRHFLYRHDLPSMTVRQVRLRQRGGRFHFGVKDLYLLHAAGAADTWRRVYTRPEKQGTALRVYANGGAMPRAFLMPRYALARSLGEGLDFPQRALDARREVAIELPAGVSPPPPPSAAAEPGQATVTSYEPERVEVEATVAGGAWLVLSEVVFPGWTASVDGREVPIARADGLFRAVWLEAGPHRAVFRYRPRSFAIGLALSGLGALTWAAAFSWRPARWLWKA